MRQTAPRTPLIALLRQLTPDQRQEFAALAGHPVSYLYALGSCSRTSCRADTAYAVEQASIVMHAKYGSDLISMQTLATMCSCVKD